MQINCISALRLARGSVTEKNMENKLKITVNVCLVINCIYTGWTYNELYDRSLKQQGLTQSHLGTYCRYIHPCGGTISPAPIATINHAHISEYNKRSQSYSSINTQQSKYKQHNVSMLALTATLKDWSVLEGAVFNMKNSGAYIEVLKNKYYLQWHTFYGIWCGLICTPLDL